MFRSFLSLMIHQLVICDALIKDKELLELFQRLYKPFCDELLNFQLPLQILKPWAKRSETTKR